MPSLVRAHARASTLSVAIGLLLMPATATLAQNVPPDAPAPSKPAPPTTPPDTPKDASHAAMLDVVRVRGLQPTSLPTRIPTTTAGITGAEVIDTINATDAEDALKYLPSLLVRKRYIGDYDHAVLATRASGTGNSARSLVYADGILLSNLLGNGASFTPRWGLVNPEEIERVDVLYGPFSAAYSGNSVGAVVDYVTRMPDRFEAHAKLGYSVEHFDLHRTHADYPATSMDASLGDRWNHLSAWLSVSRLDTQGHPIVFANLPASSATPGTGVPVTGDVPGLNPRNQPWSLVGTSGQTHSVQDQAKLKLAYDLTDTLRLGYVFGLWRNDVFRDAQTYLHAADGTPVYSGDVLVDGHHYLLPPSAIALQRADQQHHIQGLTLKRHTDAQWDYSLALSRYDYATDLLRSPLVALPQARNGGAGRIADSHGTGWTTASGRVTWRPGVAHVVEFGAQADAFHLRTQVSDTPDWMHGAPQGRFSAFAGTTTLRSLFLQDTWTLSPRWTTMLGARLEHWQARDGELANATTQLGFPRRSERNVSPKAAVRFSPDPDWSIKASIGRAVRYPTVSELYQGTIATDAIVNNNPNLKPERSVTSELSYVRNVALGHLRITAFHEQTRDALYSQTNVTATPNVTSIQNVDAIRTSGLELATDLTGVGSDVFDLSASLAFADSIIEQNRNFPASVGKWQPRVPRWRANLVGTYHPGVHWSVTGALRYSGRQFNTLDNADTNSYAYTGTSPFLVADARVRYRVDEHWSAALGVDNLTNRTYWNFHPYNQRTWNVELRFDE
jgi:iron complex outermembrane receptor protein